MFKPRIVEATPYLIAQVAIGATERTLAEARGLGYRDVEHMALVKAVEQGMKWALISAHGQPVAVFGVTDVLPGVGRLWMIRTAAAECHARMAKRLMRLLTDGTWRRLEATVRCDFAAGWDFLEWLGFNYEGASEGYCMDGEAMAMFSIVRGGA